MRFVIIGGDAAGMSAASKAKRLSPESEIIVFEQTEDVSYSACGMPYNISDPGLSVEELVVREADVFRDKQGIDLRTGHCVTEIDRENKTVRGTESSGTMFESAYDKLLIATGASSIIPAIPGIDSEGVLSLKTLEDARRIKSYIKDKSVSKAIIIGMGYIALEMAESLRKQDIAVAMVKPRKRLLPWMNGKLSDIIYSELLNRGVEMYPGHAVNSVEKTGTGLKAVCEDLELECDMIIPAIGVKPNSEVARNAGIETGASGSVAVNRCCQTSDPDIYAAGDCADAYCIVTGRKLWVPLALQANRSGAFAADNIFGEPCELQGISGSSVFKVFGLQVARAGLNAEEAASFGFDPAEVAVETRSRAHGFPGNETIHISMVGDKKSGRIVGAQMVGAEGVAHRIHSIAVALHCRMTVEDFRQTDLAYAPPFSPVWDPLLTAANQLAKKM